MAKRISSDCVMSDIFAHLNNGDDLTAVIHGHADLEALTNDGVAKLLWDHHVNSNPIDRLSLIS